jgi:hypothetical protein
VTSGSSSDDDAAPPQKTVAAAAAAAAAACSNPPMEEQVTAVALTQCAEEGGAADDAQAVDAEEQAVLSLDYDSDSSGSSEDFAALSELLQADLGTIIMSPKPKWCAMAAFTLIVAWLLRACAHCTLLDSVGSASGSGRRQRCLTRTLLSL